MGQGAENLPIQTLDQEQNHDVALRTADFLYRGPMNSVCLGRRGAYKAVFDHRDKDLRYKLTALPEYLFK